MRLYGVGSKLRGSRVWGAWGGTIALLSLASSCVPASHYEAAPPPKSPAPVIAVNESPVPVIAVSAPPRVTPLSPDLNPQAVQLNRQGATKVQQGDYAGAIQDFSQALSLSPKFAQAYLGRGVAYGFLGKNPDAIQDYTQAIQLQPDFAEAYLQRADGYEQMGQSEAAIADWQTAKQLFQQQGDREGVQLAEIHLKQGNATASDAPKALDKLGDKPGDKTSETGDQGSTAIAATPANANLSPEAALATYLTENGAKMYAAYWCPYCQRQLRLFGEAKDLVPYVECDPRGANSRRQLCVQAKIRSFPTWEINGKFYRGMRTLDELADLAGYQGSRNFTYRF